ncbi:MAG: hypothetical protein ABH804_03175 [archaeon]
MGSIEEDVADYRWIPDLSGKELGALLKYEEKHRVESKEDSHLLDLFGVWVKRKKEVKLGEIIETAEIVEPNIIALIKRYRLYKIPFFGGIIKVFYPAPYS